MRHRRSCTPRRGHRSCIGQSCSGMPANCSSRTSRSWSTWDAGWQKQVDMLQVLARQSVLCCLCKCSCWGKT